MQLHLYISHNLRKKFLSKIKTNCSNYFTWSTQHYDWLQTSREKNEYFFLPFKILSLLFWSNRSSNIETTFFVAACHLKEDRWPRSVLNICFSDRLPTAYNTRRTYFGISNNNSSSNGERKRKKVVHIWR